MVAMAVFSAMAAVRITVVGMVLCSSAGFARTYWFVIAVTIPSAVFAVGAPVVSMGAL